MAEVKDEKLLRQMHMGKALNKLKDSKKSTASITYIGFIRVSTSRQEEYGQSLETQEAIIEDYCKRRGFSLATTYKLSESSSKKHRPKFTQFLNNIKTTKGKVAVVVTRVDRLTRRDCPDLEDMRVADKLEIHFVQEQTVLTKNSTPDELDFWDSKVLSAKKESRLLTVRVNEVRAGQLQKGQYLRKAPIGYINTVDVLGNKNIVPDPKRAHLVSMLFERFAKEDMTITTIHEYAKKIGLTGNKGKEILRSSVANILHRPFYCGFFVDNNSLYSHSYKTIISLDLYIKVQNILFGRNKKKNCANQKNAKVFILSGIIKCSCGCRLSPYVKEKKNGKKYYYLKCSHASKSVPCSIKDVSENVFLQQIKTEVLSQLAFDKEILKICKPAIKREVIARRNEDARLLSNLLAQKKEEESLQENYIKLLATGRLEQEDYEKAMKKSKEVIASLEEQIESAKVSQEEVDSVLKKVFKLLESGLSLFESSKVAEKNQFLKILLSNCIYDGEKLQISLKKPFCNFLQNGLRTSWQPQPDSNRCSRLERAVS